MVRGSSLERLTASHGPCFAWAEAISWLEGRVVRRRSGLGTRVLFLTAEAAGPETVLVDKAPMWPRGPGQCFVGQQTLTEHQLRPDL